MKTLLVLFILAIIPMYVGYVEGQCKPDVVGECPDSVGKYTETRSPNLQVEHGIVHTNVICLDGRELIIKDSNGFPACVYPESIPKLIERGWAKSLNEQCAMAFDQFMDSVRNMCAPIPGEAICEPEGIVDMFSSSTNENLRGFKSWNCASFVDDWHDLTENPQELEEYAIDWQLVSQIHNENAAYLIYGLNERFQPNKVGQKIQPTISYWDNVTCSDYTVQIIDKLTGAIMYNEFYHYDCKPEKIGKYGKMILRPMSGSDFMLSLPGEYVFEISSDALKISEEFFVECTPTVCDFLTDEQLQDR